ncbi:MAG: late competence development ComFB family protein [Dethiobacteria bacterium]|jgi:competence protein ComFB|nr:late competence development ComFB family protein [Bacillota bacterium]NMD33591.1 late competence development ComFB family protein [Bacillota bacterium]HOB28496.1 late competence development ComFB family protein [Bacillota bacterium]HPZ41082.1 late competence development ComFB family protein [Bacillota bacterium]HQD52174.1 late competence development ComFB family protein [Bacillota bacterium]
MYKLKNIVEQMVFNTIDELAADHQFCNCPQCRLDIAALALNNLPHHYVVTGKGEAYSRTGWLEMQKSLDVVSEVFAAIKVVQDKPRHG